MASTKEHLDMSGKGLFRGTLPAEVGLCTNLDDINLSGNQLTGTLPSALGSLSALSKPIPLCSRM